MTDERLTIWLGFAKFILGTVALGLVSTILNQQIQQREIELREQAQMGEFLQYALEANVGYRQRLAQFFATVTRSDEARTHWREYLELVEREYAETQAAVDTVRARVAATTDPAARDSLRAEVQFLEGELQPAPARRIAGLQPRVYLHIATESQRPQAERLAQRLRGEGFLVPGIELRPNSPRESQVRYFRTDESSEAEGIAEVVRRDGTPIAVSYIAGYELSPSLRPRQYEIWLGSEAEPDG